MKKYLHPKWEDGFYGDNWAKEHDRRINEILEDAGQEKRQEILTRFRQGGINVVELAKLYNTDFLVVSVIICDNIETTTYSELRKEAK